MLNVLYLFPHYWYNTFLSSVKGNSKTTVYTDSLYNCVLPALWSQFGEEACIPVMVRGAHTVLCIVYVLSGVRSSTLINM